MFLSKVPDVLASIAVARYRKSARSTSELREAFKKAVLTSDPLLSVRIEQEHLVRATLDAENFSQLPSESRKHIEEVTGFEIPKTYGEALQNVVGDTPYEVEMLMSYVRGSYELEASCTPFLVEQLRKGTIGGEDKPVQQSDVDFAFSKSASFLDAVFIGGMGCERILSPHSMRSKAPTRTLPKRKQRTPILPTVVVLLLLFVGIYFTWAGVSSPSKIEISGMKIETSSVGLAVIFLAVGLLIVLAYLQYKGGGQFVMYPPPKVEM